MTSSNENTGSQRKRSNRIPILYCFLTLCAPALLVGCSAPTQSSTPTVVATIGPVAMILEELVGDRLDVVTLLSAGASPHMHSIRPSHARAAEEALGLFYADESIDGWATELGAQDEFGMFELVPIDMRLTAGQPSDAAHPVREYNAHFWTDPLVVQAILPGLVAALTKIDPAGEEIFTESAERFTRTLDRLNQTLSDKSTLWKGASVVVFHPSWSYYLKRYDIAIAAILEPFPGKEPTPKYLLAVRESAARERAAAILTEPQLPRRPAEMLAEMTGLPIVELDPLGSANYKLWLLESGLRLAQALRT